MDSTSSTFTTCGCLLVFTVAPPAAVTLVYTATPDRPFRGPAIELGVTAGDTARGRGVAADYEVIVIGSGHNGLVCAAYLAKAGLRTLVLERREIVGGAAVTEEFAPGFRGSRFSYVMSLLHPRVIRDLDLNAYGLEVLPAKDLFCHLGGDDFV